MNYGALSPNQLVDLFADKTQRNAAIVALISGITATELRRVKVSEAAKQQGQVVVHSAYGSCRR